MTLLVIPHTPHGLALVHFTYRVPFAKEAPSLTTPTEYYHVTTALLHLPISSQLSCLCVSEPPVLTFITSPNHIILKHNSAFLLFQLGVCLPL